MHKEKKKDAERQVRDLKESLAEDIKAGKTLSELKEDYNVSASFIYNALYDQGIKYKELLDQRRKKAKEENFSKCLNLYEELGRMPHPDEIKKIVSDGKPSFYINLLHKQFLTGSHKKKQFVEKKRVTKNPRDLINEIKKITLQMGRVPSSNELKKISKYDYKEYIKFFGGFREALGKANANKLISKSHRDEIKFKKQQELINYLREKSNELGHLPNKKIMLNDPVHNYMQYYRLFGSFMNALKKAGLLEKFTSGKHKLRSQLKPDFADGNF